jgi:hypothetical protein
MRDLKSSINALLPQSVYNPRLVVLSTPKRSAAIPSGFTRAIPSGHSRQGPGRVFIAQAGCSQSRRIKHDRQHRQNCVFAALIAWLRMSLQTNKPSSGKSGGEADATRYLICAERIERLPCGSFATALYEFRRPAACCVHSTLVRGVREPTLAQLIHRALDSLQWQRAVKV